MRRWTVAVLVALPVACTRPGAAQTAGRAEGRTPARASAAREASPPSWEGPSGQLVWLDAREGIESIQMQTFFADFDQVSAGFLPTSGIGPTVRLGAGVRLGFLTLGVRGRVASFDDSATVGSWQVWTLDAELGMRAPLGRLEPHVAFTGGYSSFGGFGGAVGGLRDGLDVHGVDAGLGGGVEYWVTRAVSLGLDVDAQLLAIARPGISVRDLSTAKQVGTVNDAKARILEANGSSVGTALAATGGIAAHF